MSQSFGKQFDYHDTPQSAGIMDHLGKTTHLECPACKGAKEVFAFINTGDDHRKHRQDMVPRGTCGGVGKITTLRAYWIDKGQQMREERMARGETLKSAAERLAMTPAQLSAIEGGRLPSDEVCEVCCGDCSGANPPILNCPNRSK